MSSVSYKRTTVYVSPYQLERIKALEEVTGESQSEFIREAIAERLARIEERLKSRDAGSQQDEAAR